ncbi:hypothetical protein MRB53_030604 [Persea americana]|uniref:Uncharacterized protein n=1 Tax=Persea americana TaxID=3435 RepID=A0ACC2KM45_PERAE|nr:hypothetical protein MRB53_030604 [Persea americana]
MGSPGLRERLRWREGRRIGWRMMGRDELQRAGRRRSGVRVCWEEDGAWRRWVVRDEEEGDGRWMGCSVQKKKMESLGLRESPAQGDDGLGGG